MPPDVVERDCVSIKDILHAGKIWVLGGEPLLHPQIDFILQILTSYNITEQVNVSTNGRLLSKMSEQFWKLIYQLDISVYPNLDMAQVELAKAKSKQYGFKVELRYNDEFWVLFNQRNGKIYFEDCPFHKICRTIHNGYFYLCPPSVFFTTRFMELPEGIDGIPLKGITEAKLKEFMARKEPLNACRICQCYTLKRPWKEARNLVEWIKESSI